MAPNSENIKFKVSTERCNSSIGTKERLYIDFIKDDRILTAPSQMNCPRIERETFNARQLGRE